MKLPDCFGWMMDEDVARYTYCNIGSSRFGGTAGHDQDNNT